MRAWQVHRHAEPREALRRVECDAPEPQPGLVCVRVAAAGIGLPDLLMCRGSYPLTPPLPFTPGQELVGEVTAVDSSSDSSSEKDGVRVGERVVAVSGFFVGHGAFAEQALAVAAFTLPAPDGMSDAEAAGFVIPFQTAWVALVRRARLERGETLLVLGGAGGTGSAAVQLGRALGARVIASVSGPERAEFCRELGAHEVVDRSLTDVSKAVLEATDGRGADVIFDPVGGEAFQAATRCIAHEGRLLAVGFASGSWSNPDTADLVNRNYSVVGVIPSAYPREVRLAAHAELCAMHSKGELRVPVEATPFDSLPDALETLARGRVRGKLAVTVG